ncbi:MAG: hypothetical protein Q7T24_01010, partial [Deltaproteobacteria bacterium]|nr:hypothetical protein [Deltaproteobacteria bacterium]
MRRLKNAAFPISLIITCLFTIAMTYSGEPSKKGFASPSGKIEVVFTKVHGRKSSEKEKSRDTDN